MEKSLRFFPAGLFLLLFGKTLAMGATYPDALVMLILAGWAVSHEVRIKDHEKKELRAEFQKVLDRQVEVDKTVQTMRNNLESFKIMKMR